MTRNLLAWTSLAALAALVALAMPGAAESYEGKPDCPPDMACTLNAPGGDGNATADDPQALGPEDCVECSKLPARGPEDCENCRGDGDGAGDTPTYDGNCGGEVCVTSHQPAGNGTCMDGAEPWEICDRDVQYLDGGNGQPIERHSPASSGDSRAVPGLGVAGVALAGFAVAALVAARRKY